VIESAPAPAAPQANSANGEYDLLRSKRLKLTQHDLTRIGKIFGTS
jgi:hypothetical protein